MRRIVAIAALAVCSLVADPWAAAQNDWQFPDPYFGAIEFDVARPPRPSQRRIDQAQPPRPTRPPRQRMPRSRPRWTASGART